MFDVCVIGGGTAGISAAKTASGFNLKTVIFEKSLLGGVCLNEGCVLSKVYLQSLYESRSNETPDLCEIYEKFDKIRKSFAQKTKSDLLAAGIETVESEAEILPKGGDVFRIAALNGEGRKQVFESKYLIIASGSAAKRNGISFPKTQDEIPREVDIVGAGIAGFEAAQIFNALGSRVRVLEKSDVFCADLSRNAVNILEQKMRKNGIEFVKNFRESDASFLNGKRAVYFADGRKFVHVKGVENLSLDFCSNDGKNAIAANEFCETSHENCFAVGDVNGKSMLAHTAAQEGFVAVNRIMKKNVAAEYENIPLVLYTDPPIARVGILPPENAECDEYEIRRAPLGGNAKFRAKAKDGERGLFEAVIEKKTRRIAGLHLISPDAEEISGALALIVQLKMTEEQMKGVVFAHPTIGEIIKETILSRPKT